MARKWLYFPFKDITRDPTMPGNLSRYQEKYKADLQVAYKGDSLAGVGDDEMLIIAGHGLPNSGRIGVTTDPGIKMNTMFGTVYLQKPTQITTPGNDLANELADDCKLPQTHKYIKLITCGGAGMAAVDELNATHSQGVVTAVAVTAHSYETECLASVLAKALGLRGYGSVMVKGYPGFVGGTTAQKTVSVELTSAQGQRQEWWQQMFDTGGVALGSESWKDKSVGMGSVPSKLLNDYWFDNTGTLKKQHISL